MWAIGGLLLLAVALPLIVSVVAGSLEIPRNDDWSYRRIALELARTGKLDLGGMSTTLIVGQVLFTQPFLWLSDLQPWAFTVVGVIFAVGAILSAYALARQLLPPRHAALAAGLLAVFPGYLAYATSFMSDVPALAAQFLCLTLGAIAVRHRPIRMGWLIASVAVGIFGFTIREFAVAAPASVLLAAIIAERGRPRTWALAIAVAAGCVAIYLWKSTLPGHLPPVGPGYGSLAGPIRAFSSVAFVLAPAALLGAIKWRDHVRRIDLLIGLQLGTILAGARLLQWVQKGSIPPVMLDNLASQWGAPDPRVLVGLRPLLFPDAAWAAVNGLALVATVAVLAMITGIAGAHLRRCDKSMRTFLSRLGSRAGIIVLFSLAVTGGLLVFGLSRPVFDRYFWPLVPTLATLLLFVPGDLEEGAPAISRRRGDLALAGSATVFTVVLATVSVVFLLNAHAFDAARWVAGQQLIASGLPPDEIDAGYEWVGYHATSQGNPTLSQVSVIGVPPDDPGRDPSTNPFYRRWWPAFAPCGVVSSRILTLPGADLVGSTDYSLNLVSGPTETLYLYRISSPGCQP